MVVWLSSLGGASVVVELETEGLPKGLECEWRRQGMANWESSEDAGRGGIVEERITIWSLLQGQAVGNC